MTAGTPHDQHLVVAMTGASGAPYAVRLLHVLDRPGRTIHLTLTPSAAQVLREEMGLRDRTRRVRSRVLRHCRRARQLVYHHYQDFGAGIASGSFPTAGMVIIPCSMSTLGAIAGGITTNLITRAADVHLKERRKLIVVPRETPLSLIHLENMLKVTQAGAVVLPAMPGWYHRPAPARRPDRLRRRPDLRPARHRQQLDQALGRQLPARAARGDTRRDRSRERARPDADRTVRRSLKRWRTAARTGAGRTGRLDHRRIRRDRSGPGPRACPARQGRRSGAHRPPRRSPRRARRRAAPRPAASGDPHDRRRPCRSGDAAAAIR